MKDSGVDWIGEIPENWNMRRVKSSYKNHKDVVGRESFNYERLALTLNGVIKRNKEDTVGLQPENFDTYQILKTNELVFKLIDLQNVSTSRVGYSAFTGIVSPAYIILTPKNKVSSKFGEYYFKSMWQREIFNHIGDDGVRSSLNASDLLNIPYPIIEYSEQQKIADFLDEKCGAIDEIINKTEQSIEEYKKLKQSVITKAVTKGIRPDRKMKDSNIDWIGKIPEDWEIKKIKYLFSLRDERNNLPLSEVNLISLYTDIGVIQHCDIEATTGNKAQTADGYKKVYTDDIVVNIILCWMGAIGVSAYEGVTSPAYDVYKPNKGAYSKFYHYYFRTKGFNGECYKVGRGIMLMRWRTYSEQFKAIKVIVPPLDEQKEIADYLDEKCAEIDTLIEKKQQFLAEMSNYRKSLIYEYVTGKKEVA